MAPTAIIQERLHHEGVATSDSACSSSRVNKHNSSLSDSKHGDNSYSVQNQKQDFEFGASDETREKKRIYPRTHDYLNESAADRYRYETSFTRGLVLAAACIVLIYKEPIQAMVDGAWDYLRHKPFFYSAYFESVYVTVVYGLVIALYPFVMHYLSFLSMFKVRADVIYHHQTIVGILKDAVVYLAPLFFADSIIQKKYTGVPESEWVLRNRQWIQTTRALPEAPPCFLTACFHVIASVVAFDAAFFLLHLSLHRSAFLYRHVHAIHHRHGTLHAHVTNQLHVVERGAIVVAANYSLKLFSAHPLTRLAFVVVFLWLLVDNHSGYDLPWSPHRLAPSGLMGGPAKHHAHHHAGSTKHFQPFFTYLDHALDILESSSAPKAVGSSLGKSGNSWTSSTIQTFYAVLDRFLEVSWIRIEFLLDRLGVKTFLNRLQSWSNAGVKDKYDKSRRSEIYVGESSLQKSS